MSILSALLFAALTADVSDASRYLIAGGVDSAAPTAAPPAGAQPTPVENSTAAGADSGSAQSPPVASGTAPGAQAEPKAPSIPSQPAASTPAQIDVRVQPAAPLKSSDPQKSVVITTVKPSDLMRNILKPPAAGQLAGAPLTLSEAVRDARSRPDQTQRAKAYWDLSAAMADYNLAQLEEMEFGILRQGLRTPANEWDLKQQAARARTDIARGSAQAAQLRLHQLLGRPAYAALPLPGDVPHCGRYNAEYEEIFAARPDPIAEQLSKLMPLRYNDLRNQAQAVAEAETLRDAVRQRLDPNSGGAELLQAQDLLALRRRAFVNTARDYNQDIAAYTELAAPANVPADRLVAMMIRTSAPVGQAPWSNSGVEQASALQPIPQASTDSQETAGPRQTFANGQQLDQQQQQQREVHHSGPLQRIFGRDREHSILVNRPHLLRRALGNQ
jgi:hypothetical protein